MSATPSYEEIVNFIAAGTTAESVVAFRPTKAAIQRVEDLVAKSRDGVISSEEQAELDDYFQLEHLLILAKARARQNRTSSLRSEISDDLRLRGYYRRPLKVPVET